MAKYINPLIVSQAANTLQLYKKTHPESKTPLFDFVKDKDADTRAAFVRAAQRLKWAVVRSKGHVYENGLFLW